MTTTPKPATCRDCGARNVTWRQSKAGKWYLADLATTPRGREYAGTPHFKSCTVANAARNARVLADETKRRAEIRAYMQWDGARYIDTRTGEEWAI